MKVTIVSGAFGFLKPLAESKNIGRIISIRDKKDIISNKIKYFHPSIFNPPILKNIHKLILAIKHTSKNTKLSIGIYEIPHGLIAFISGKLRKIPVLISIIGNPGYTVKRKGIWKLLMYYMLKHSRFVTVTGQNSKEILINNGVKSENIYILPNAVDTELFKPVKTSKKYDIVSLARLSLEKDLELFIRIIHQLKKEIPSIKTAIAGTGPQFDSLEKLIEEMELENNIELKGFVKDSNEFFNSGRIFLLTSFTEGLPRTVAEAMATGLPCIASNVGDVSDIVINGINGFTIDNREYITDYIEKVKSLLEDDNLYDNFSCNAMDHIVEKYSYPAATTAWDKIISKL